ncbi:aminopeptidase P N-terminal domain-containing protein [Pseudenhygromyxa sp. WMMC2535]|uniref:aminopeptidase P N-terminal domain-containing protein n=1 Tax=Pseudenhygromyxa sp. WMMC2535 TaxID=2712867 RepID=UPI00155164D6|nr:aminopeptidase P N-terminal domain-containing protein [Pseudenhygromyxa sp. WMMC2535]NVB42039.1 aminopeptidase P N-terminal domain-containing protein [Pseudenhygromyxa sp. WMMC2535]
MPRRPSPDLETYSARRSRLADSLRDENAVLVLYGGELRTRSNDTEFRFRPDSDFHYMTGLEEPGALALLLPGAQPGEPPRFVAFVRPRDPAAEVWSGRRVGPQGAIEQFGADEAYAIDELATRLPELIDGYDTVYLPIGRWPALDTALATAIHSLRRRNREGCSPPRRLGEVGDLIGEDRLHKDAAALASLRRAIELSAAAHIAAMRATRAGMWEYEIEALIEYEFRRQGSSGPGYGSIVGTGDNATILHYVDNRDQLREGEVLLVDAGAEWDYFSGDITRSWPVSGRFSAEQRAVYEVVLAANVAGIAAAEVGGSIDAIHETCLKVLCEGIAELGLIDAKPDAILEQRLYRRFYMHRTSHWLGVDVHDVGRYTLGGDPRPFAPGQVLTVEPGLYISASDESVAEGFRGIGVRIEDDVLITAAGPEVLSAKAPKAADEVEALVRGG